MYLCSADRVEGLSLVGADMICPASEEIKAAASPDGVIWQEREDTPPLQCILLYLYFYLCLYSYLYLQLEGLGGHSVLVAKTF